MGGSGDVKAHVWKIMDSEAGIQEHRWGGGGKRSIGFSSQLGGGDTIGSVRAVKSEFDVGKSPVIRVVVCVQAAPLDLPGRGGGGRCNFNVYL